VARVRSAHDRFVLQTRARPLDRASNVAVAVFASANVAADWAKLIEIASRSWFQNPAEESDSLIGSQGSRTSITLDRCTDAYALLQDVSKVVAGNPLAGEAIERR
jgi:hypothetical protein